MKSSTASYKKTQQQFEQRRLIRSRISVQKWFANPNPTQLFISEMFLLKSLIELKEMQQL